MNNCFGRLTKPDPYLHFGALPLPEIERVTIDGAPRFMRGFRALLCTDVHLRRSVSDARLGALIDRIASAEADILLLGGDYGEGADQCDRFFEALERVRFPLGVYAVPGNNDLSIGNPKSEIRGVRFLINRRADIPRSGGTIEIGGCDDHELGRPDTAHLFSSAENRYRILLSHHPILPECEADLMLCGHTHGGQFNLFGITPYTVGFEARLATQAVRGLHRRGNMWIYVCSGIGTSRLALRVGAAPRMALLEFGR